MKKILVLMLAVVLMFSAVACTTPDDKCTSHVDADNNFACDNCAEDMPMTYAEYAAAPKDAAVCIVTYVQAKQSWWEDEGQGKGTFYTQSEDGAYFIYEMHCTREEYDQLTKGTKILVKGYKEIWSEEHEIIEATFKILEGSYIATPMDATNLLGSADLSNHQNKLVSFKDMTVVASNDEGAAFLYGWDGSGYDGGDLYFKASVGVNIYTFVIESYLTDKNSDVYNAVKALNVGDTIDMEGFLYWYNGVQPHITSIDVKTAE